MVDKADNKLQHTKTEPCWAASCNRLQNCKFGHFDGAHSCPSAARPTSVRIRFVLSCIKCTILTLVVPRSAQKGRGFSPCILKAGSIRGESPFPDAGFAARLKPCPSTGFLWRSAQDDISEFMTNGG